VGANDRLDAILDSVVDPDDGIIEVIHDYPFVEVLNAFAELGMNPSMSFWSKFFAKKYLGKAYMGDLAMAVADHVGPAGLPSTWRTSQRSKRKTLTQCCLNY